MPEMDYSKLKAKMVEKGFNQKKLAKEIGISESHFVRKLKGEYPFTQKEINLICQILEIEQVEIGSYFFTHLVKKTKQVSCA